VDISTGTEITVRETIWGTAGDRAVKGIRSYGHKVQTNEGCLMPKALADTK